VLGEEYFVIRHVNERELNGAAGVGECNPGRGSKPAQSVPMPTCSSEVSQVFLGRSMPPHMLQRCTPAIELLREALRCCTDLARWEWEMAVDLKSLEATGITQADLRLLVARGIIGHCVETTLCGERARSFRPNQSSFFDRRSCFVLQSVGSHKPGAKPEPPALDAGIERPRWDPDRLELRLGSVVVKQFKAPAPNQETVLAAFEEEGWPARIDDPLPPHSDIDPKRRLNDTIKCLNRSQKRTLLRFLGDGTGEGVRWECVGRGEINGYCV
jgi:hypothetical protein